MQGEKNKKLTSVTPSILFFYRSYGGKKSLQAYLATGSPCVINLQSYLQPGDQSAQSFSFLTCQYQHDQQTDHVQFDATISMFDGC